jgi:hypothetical protein
MADQARDGTERRELEAVTAMALKALPWAAS